MGLSSASDRKPWYEILVSLTPLILGVFVTGAGVIFTNSYNQRQLELNEENNKQQMQMNQINMMDKFRPYLISSDAVEREFAYASFATLGQERLALRLMNIKNDSAGRSVAENIEQTSSAAIKAEATRTLSAVKPKILIHYAKDSQKDLAKEIAWQLKSDGYVVPGIENISSKAVSPKITNVRYFNDVDKPVADSIATLLSKNGLEGARSYRVGQYSVTPGNLEVWFSAENSVTKASLHDEAAMQ